MFCGIILVGLTLPTVAPWQQSLHFIFAKFNTVHDSNTGVRGRMYLFLDNCMVATYCLIGWDACAHMSEETTGAQKSIPRAIIASVVASASLGFMYMVSLLVSIQDPNTLMTGQAHGFVAAQIFYDAFDARYGDGRIGTILLAALPGSAIFMGCIAATLSGSRMAYSFARSEGIPFSSFFSVVDRHTHTPLRTVWLLTGIAFVIGLPLLKSQEAFGAVTEMAYVALLISYAIPISCRHTFCRKLFVPGPFSLGRWSKPIGWIGIGWTALAVVLFNCPSAYPEDTTASQWTFDYAAPMILLGVFVGCTISWHFPFGYGAKHWYGGPPVPQRITQAMTGRVNFKRGMGPGAR
ncbi:hypothetical protein WJX73_006939 [Symbiochloris irregularis]|uniref:Amino acid permease n=1 Tax=Symbiochloris irregularis TaxID=706552 RepID=A0AAW1NNV9_9CHLO